MSSERLRQREVHKYYQSWLESSVGFHDKATTEATRYHTDGTKFSVSKDTALTSFAQLGCLKLNVKRAVVTLISTERQYILAEATSSSLLSSDGDDETTDDIWFGNASIPRSQGVSGSALAPPEYTARSPKGTSFTCPALVIDDLAEHPDFCSRPYAGNGISFYCGIPIITSDGNAIGVYSLSDDQPRNGLQPLELRYLHDLSSVIMRHLVTVKNEAARFRGESMVLGLGQFIQGASTISAHESFRRRMPSPPSRPDLASPSLSRSFKGLTITAADPSALHAVSHSQSHSQTRYEAASPSAEAVETRDAAQAEHDGGKNSNPAPVSTKPSDTDPPKTKGEQSPGNTIFTRAANILRECCGADGVLFFDAVSTNLAKRSSTTGFQSSNKTSTSEGRDNWSPSFRRTRSASSHNSTMQESEDVDSSEAIDSSEENVSSCSLLGFSVDVTGQTRQRTQELKRLAMTEGILRRLIRRYPQGKIFFFSPTGELSSSENDATASSAASDTSTVNMTESTTPGAPKSRSKGFKSKFADELKRLVPQAQSVIWLPLWDFSKQRWSAGAFLWTKMAEQLIMAQDDLTYLKTFANSIMIEVARQDAASADDTKTTFIANISHELRSPLHGVIGSCELLKDTHLDEHQASLLRAIELCGKTLNDTIDHVLDYTKINQLMRRGGHLDRPGTKARQPNVPAVDKSMLEDDFDLAVLVQDAVETVCASQSSQHHRLRGQSSGSMTEDDTPTDTADEKAVQIVLKLTHQDSWWVRSQPGAIKRILANLVQNALKYTDRGRVTIALAPRGASFKGFLEGSDEKKATRKQDIILTVTDTGRGMSKDFVRNHAFTPFSQESSFSDGTGLGLSIVQLIVDSLGGKIELKSRPDVGTEIKIHLTLLRSTAAAQLSEDEPQSIESTVAGKCICLVGPEPESSMNQGNSFEAAVSNIATAWLNMKVKTSSSFTSMQADFYLYTAVPRAVDIIRKAQGISPSASSSIILLASNAPEKLKLKRELEKLEQQGTIIEVVLHPIGPHKLSEVLKRCLSRQDEINVRHPFHLPAIEARESPVESHAAQQSTLQQNAGSEDVSQTTDLPIQQINATNKSSPQSPNTRQRTSIRIPTTKSPPNKQADREIPDSATTNTRSEVKASIEPNSTSKRILLVDDNAINLNILKAAMKMGKFAFDTANDGLEALEAFKQAAQGVSKPFTHILMDINMPVMDGIESTRLIRQFEKELASRNNRSRMSTRGIYWTDRGKSADELRSASFPPVFPGDENENTADEQDYADPETNQSDYGDSIPMSPVDQTEKYLATLRSQRKRPLLSTSQTGREPARASTYSVDQGQSTSFTLASFQPWRPQETPVRAMIIALSGVAFEQTQREMFNAGADMFFAKPIKLKELIKLLDKAPTDPES